MLTFIIRRSLLALLTIWALSVISFVVIQLPPGDFVDQYILDLVQGGAEGAETTPAMLDLAETLRIQFGLNKPSTSSTASGYGGSYVATSASRWCSSRLCSISSPSAS